MLSRSSLRALRTASAAPLSPVPRALLLTPLPKAAVTRHVSAPSPVRAVSSLAPLAQSRSKHSAATATPVLKSIFSSASTATSSTSTGPSASTTNASFATEGAPLPEPVLKALYYLSAVEPLVTVPLPTQFKDLPPVAAARTVAADIGASLDPAHLISQLPRSMRPYAALARLQAPIGTWLLLLPCYWGAVMGSAPGAMPSLSLLTAFAVGALVMRGAGCTINDMWDKDFDSRVARTRERPIASGAVTRKQAAMFVAAQCLAGLGVLKVIGSMDAALIAIASLPFVVAYPLAKRHTNWPQAVLGVTFNWGLWVGHAAVAGLDATLAHAPALAVFHAGAVLWTIFYDTIYALQDTADDKKIGVKSTALHFGEYTPAYLRALAWGASSLFAAGALLYGDVASLHTVALAAVVPLRVMLGQVQRLEPGNREACAAMFRKHRNVGMWVLLGLALGSIAVAVDREQDELKKNRKEAERAMKEGMSVEALLAGPAAAAEGAAATVTATKKTDAPVE